MAAEINFSPAELLEEVDKAIFTVLVGGQSYKVGSRQMTRADLNLLYHMKNDLTAQIAANTSSELIGDTYAAVFDGR